jgi:hypothetical protein
LRPQVKEDDVDLERRHESVEKQKSTKYMEKKKEKKKNLEWQALENTVRSRGRRGSPRRTLVTRTIGTRATVTATTPRGLQLASIESLKARREPMLIHRGRGLPRGHQVVLAPVNKRRCRRAALVPIPLLRQHRARPFPSRNPLQNPERATGSIPWRRGH